MPIRRVSLADLESVIDELEKKNRIVGVSHPDEGSAVITFEPRGKRAAPGDVETR